MFDKVQKVVWKEAHSAVIVDIGRYVTHEEDYQCETKTWFLNLVTVWVLFTVYPKSTGQ